MSNANVEIFYKKNTDDVVVPGAVRNIRFDEILFNMATIIWDPPLEPNGVITSKIYFRYK